VCDLETSRMGAPYIYDISRLRVNNIRLLTLFCLRMIKNRKKLHGQNAEILNVTGFGTHENPPGFKTAEKHIALKLFKIGAITVA